MNIKKIIPVLLVAILLLIGCSARGGQEKDIDPETAAKAILEGVQFRDTLVKAEGGAAEMYYQLTGDIADYSIYISGSGATAEEVAVLKVTQGANRADVQGIVDKRISDLKYQFKDYVPKEMVKLDDPVIVSNGDMVILVLSDDSEAAKKLVDGLFK